MWITIKLFAIIRVGRFASATREYKPGSTVGDIIRDLRIPERELGMILINGLPSEPEQMLREGDTLSVFPLVGGVNDTDMRRFQPGVHTVGAGP